MRENICKSYIQKNEEFLQLSNTKTIPLQNGERI